MLYSLLQESENNSYGSEYERTVTIEDICDYAISSVYECRLTAAEIDDACIVAEYCSLLPINEGVGDMISKIFSTVIGVIKKVIAAIGKFFNKIFSFLGDLFNGGGKSGKGDTSRPKLPENSNVKIKIHYVHSASQSGSDIKRSSKANVIEVEQQFL